MLKFLNTEMNSINTACRVRKSKKHIDYMH